jgi:hypothetical protein
LGVGGQAEKLFSVNIKKMRWVGRVARMGSIEVYTGKSEVENQLEQLGSFGRIILK